MRIALVIERFEPRGGGVEAVAWNVAQSLATGATGGDRVHVFARQASAEARERARVEIHTLEIARPGWQPLRVWKFSRAAAAATHTHTFDVVQTFSRTRHQDVFRAGGGCHAAYMERAYSRAGRILRFASPRHALALAIERAVFADPKQVILCNSEMVRDEIAERHRVPDERLAVIVNGVDTEAFRPGRSATAEKLRAERTGVRRVWLLVGSGFARKGVETALRCLARRPADEALWIAGSDPVRPWEVRADALGILDRVRFLGRRDDLADVYGAADALLLPTRYDAFANVCLEAAASGLPVVTSAANGAARWLEDGGIVIGDSADSDAFSDALDQLGSDAFQQQMGAAARARAETATWPHHVHQLRALYERIAS